MMSDKCQASVTTEYETEMVTKCNEDRLDVLYVFYQIVENSVRNQTIWSNSATFDVPEKKTYNFKDSFVLCVRELTDWFSQACSSSEGKEMKEDIDRETQNLILRLHATSVFQNRLEIKRKVRFLRLH